MGGVVKAARAQSRKNKGHGEGKDDPEHPSKKTTTVKTNAEIEGHLGDRPPGVILQPVRGCGKIGRRDPRIYTFLGVDITSRNGVCSHLAMVYTFHSRPSPVQTTTRGLETVFDSPGWLRGVLSFVPPIYLDQCTCMYRSRRSSYL